MTLEKWLKLESFFTAINNPFSFRVIFTAQYSGTISRQTFLKNRKSLKMSSVPNFAVVLLIPIDFIEKNRNRPHIRSRNSTTNRRCKWTLKPY